MTYCECSCICGKRFVAFKHSLISGVTKSCGCKKGYLVARANTIHGQATSKNMTAEFRAWSNMLKRCAQKGSYCEKRNIVVCSHWQKFENFFADMGKRPSKLHSLDRLNNNKGYSPKNCAWRTKEEQSNNTSTNRIIKFKGEKFTMAQFARKLGFPYHVVRNRLSSGWSIEKTAETPLRDRSALRPSKMVTFCNETMSIKQAAKRYGLRLDTLLWRVENGWSVAKALMTTPRKSIKHLPAAKVAWL